MDDLIGAVLEKASGDAGLGEDAKLVLLTMLTPDDVAGTPLPVVDAPGLVETKTPGQPASGARAGAVRAFLSSVRVAGFRGIGAPADLRFIPGPGLTVVAGRNGSGKSSFAEALEVSLTRDSYRWKQRTAVWHESWRNLHHPEPTEITVSLTEAGVGVTTVGASWAPGASLGDVQVWTQRPAAKRQQGLTALGWGRDLELFRPFLSYDELGALFAEPSKLYDALAPILGLDRLEDAVKKLAAHVKVLSEPAAQATAQAKELRPALAASGDERASSAAALITAKAPDLDAVSALVTGAAAPDDSLSLLRALAAVTAPDVSAWAQAHEHLAAATAKRIEALASAGAATLASTSLLSAALDFHDHAGDGVACPVCGVGVLDAAWAAQARAEIDKAGLFAQAVDEADADLAAARSALTRSVSPVPAVLTRAAAAGTADLPGIVTAVSTWSALAAQAPDAHLSQADVAALFEQTSAVVAVLRDQAAAAVAAKEDAWQPLALQVGQWLQQARRAGEVAHELAAAKAAEKWLKDNAAELRNARLAPLADKAREIWSALRQESNVDLGGMRLEGSATRRRVDLIASVDGQAAGALGVMSQGELHALALALFLPRATAAGSPFGFVVIDDPVQAMDPAKVDGLAQVLAATAVDRQVIVFTHDDRLPEAIRRMQIPATILEVTRDTDSVVTVAEISNPTQRYLSDARAVASDKAVTQDIARRVIPELCRFAVEATCRDVFYRREYLAGRSRHQVESDWTAANTTRARVALVVRGKADEPLDPWLTTQRRKATLGICGPAAHRGLTGNPHHAIDDVEHTVTELAATYGH